MLFIHAHILLLLLFKLFSWHFILLDDVRPVLIVTMIKKNLVSVICHFETAFHRLTATRLIQQQSHLCVMLVLLVLSHIVTYAYGSIIEKLSIVGNCVRLLFIVIDTMPLLLSNFSSS